MNVDSDNIEKLQKAVEVAENIVFFGGAGVSTESGIPDFRSQDGLYKQEYEYPPEEIVSHSFLTGKSEEFYKFYKKKMLSPYAEPNAAHRKLAEMEKKGKLKAIITQNIDGLHEKAGSKNVIDIHGSVLRNYCCKCHRRPSEDGIPYIKRISSAPGIPKCEYCGGMMRPDVVLYEESLDYAKIQRAVEYISKADLLIIGGTSLVVYPAAGFIDYFNGKCLAVINMDSTSRDNQADILIKGKIGEVLSDIKV